MRCRLPRWSQTIIGSNDVAQADRRDAKQDDLTTPQGPRVGRTTQSDRAARGGNLATSQAKIPVLLIPGKISCRRRSAYLTNRQCKVKVAHLVRLAQPHAVCFQDDPLFASDRRPDRSGLNCCLLGGRSGLARPGSTADTGAEAEAEQQRDDARGRTRRLAPSHRTPAVTK